MWIIAVLCAFAAALQTRAIGDSDGRLPVDKMYGVNLGSWLLVIPWMMPKEWVEMGGETCFQTGPCSDCAASEFDLVKKIGQRKADEVFQKHWETWFTERDVQNIVDAGLNTVRIPIGYWIIEALVDRETEFYPRGGIKQLKRGLQQLRSAGINVLFDFHALPGVANPNQMFSGHCTSDVKFYTPPNYFRALQWAAVTAFLSHVDPAFSTVFGIEAINEPITDPSMTPGYGDYLTDFSRVIRAIEFSLGITCPGVDYISLSGSGISFTRGGTSLTDVTDSSVNTAASQGSGTSNSASSQDIPTIPHLASSMGGRVGDVLTSIIPIIDSVSRQLGVNNPHAEESNSPRAELLKTQGANRQCLHTTFIDALWQGVKGFNPANAAIGPVLFDDHLFFNFGNVPAPDPESYLKNICNLPRLKNDTDLGNLPLVFDEWALSTKFNATHEFLYQWADAQKFMYSQSSGWIFWSFKIEDGAPEKRQWDYFAALEAGHFTRDPAALNDPYVCDPYEI